MTSFSLAKESPKVLLSCIVAVSVITIGLTLLLTARGESNHSVFTLSNYFGPVLTSLASGRGLDLVRAGPPYEGVVSFYAARMPFPIAFLLVANSLAGGSYLMVHIIKALLIAVPVYIACAVGITSLPVQSRLRGSILVAIPFFVPSFLLMATSLQVEEGYYYSFLALAFSLVLFRVPLKGRRWRLWLFIIALDLVYLSKSSLRVSCVVLAVAFLLSLTSRRSRTVFCALALIGPLGWGLYTWTSTGRFSLGSSLDGFNFHKGNYAQFLDRYPPADNGYMDRYDSTITPTQPLFRTEWQDSDYHAALAKDFVERHPNQALMGALAKANVYFLSLRDVGSGHKNDVLTKIDLPNMLAFRALLLSAMSLSIICLLKRRSVWPSALFLCFCAATALPYIAGFALTRHAAVLILPASLTLVRLVLVPVGEQP